jgi:SPP1 family predicted phage head-tail adaptor
MRAGQLRHRIDFQMPAFVQDTETGEMVPGWETVREKVPASFTPMDARDVFAAQAAQSEATATFLIRHWAGILPTMRIIHRGSVYSITGQPMPDNVSGLEYLKILAATGVNDG